MKTTQTPVSKCPKCGRENDNASSLGSASPSPGDLSICLMCMYVSVFADDLTLRTPTIEELARIAQSGEIKRHLDYLRQFWADNARKNN